jgi:hypothetical protein
MRIYIPIGSNCDISHFLRKNNMRICAFPFDWNCTPLKSVYNILTNNFSFFLEDIFIGERIKRLYFEDNEKDETIIENDFIYPVICKKYSTLFPHDYKSVDSENLLNVKEKYKKRIERFNKYINRPDLEIFMIFCNVDFTLNEWQKTVYDKFNIDISSLQKENNIYIDKIKDFYKDKTNIKILSFKEFTEYLNL